MATTNMNFFASSVPKGETENNEVKPQPREIGDLLYFGADTMGKLGTTIAEAIKHNTAKPDSKMVGIYTGYHASVTKAAEKSVVLMDEFRFGAGLDESPKAKI
jgi:N-acetylmuramic acid 6-phosphate (MurNAc-6-P) etherase